MKQDLIFKNFKVEDFGGIDNTKPVLLYVEEAYKEGKNIAVAKGDQEKGKTSWLTALMGLLCVNLGAKEENFVNKKSKKIDAGFEFSYKENQYRVSWTKSAFKLQKLEFNEIAEKNVWRDQLSPVAALQKLIGYVGITPMPLKKMTGAQQVDEIRKSLNVPADIQAEEKRLEKLFETAKSNRTDANREYQRLLKNLEANELYVNWEASEKKYAEEKNSETEKQKVNLLEAKKDNYKKSQQILDSLKMQQVSLDEEIEELQRKIQSKQVEKMQVDERIVTGEKYVEDNKGILAEYESAHEAYMNIQSYLAEQKQWKDVQLKKKEMDEFSDAVVKLDNQKDEIKEQLLEVGKKGLPNIEGLEIVTTDSIEGKERGVYLNDKNLAQLSESELWNLLLRIWQSQDVSFVFVENVSDLGSSAIATLNHLAKSGCKIFASQMCRGEEFSIEIVEELK